jgi:predicted transcriptional regulator
MDRQLAAALADLGLTTTESAIYVALLQRCRKGPISAYKLAQDLGRDPANLTKALSAMTRRRAVVASGQRPRLYAPAPPREFLGSLVSHLHARQEQAITLLERIGTPPDDGRPHLLNTADEALDVARKLIGRATRLILLSAAPEWLASLQEELRQAADDQGVVVLSRRTAAGPVPGPWLRLVVDGAASLSALGQPDGEALLQGSWSRNIGDAYLLHHDLGQAAVLDDLLELLEAGATSEVVRKRATEQWALVGKQVPWKKRWQELGLTAYRPAEPAAEDLDPDAVADAMAEVAAEFTPEMPGKPASRRGEATDVDEDDEASPLRFIFRRKKK